MSVAGLLGYAFGNALAGTFMMFALAASSEQRQRKATLGWRQGIRLFVISYAIVAALNIILLLLFPTLLVSFDEIFILEILHIFVLPLTVSVLTLHYLWKPAAPQQNGEKASNEDALGSTALIQAVKHGKLDRVEELILSGAEIDEQDKAGATALHHAVLNKQLDMTKFLLDAGASLFITTKKGRNAIYIAQKVNWDSGCVLLKERMAASSNKEGEPL